MTPAHSHSGSTHRRSAAPAACAAASVALGIALDRWLAIPSISWLMGGAIAVLAACLSAHLLATRPICVSLPVLVALLCAGGARHHAFWHECRSDDVRLFAREDAKLVRIVGAIDSTPAIRAARAGPLESHWSQVDQSQCLVRCVALQTDEGAEPLSGRVRLNVDGHLLHVEVDDDVEVTGWLSRPRPPANPGDVDAEILLRSQGAGAFLSVEHPDAVRRINRQRTLTLRRFLARLRSHSEDVLVQRMSPERAPLALALLLGDRSGLTDDVRDVFARSGMMHVLAISGLNVGILAALVWPFCRLLNLSPRRTAAVLIGTVVGYTCLTDAAAPVVRAAILVVVIASALPRFRAVSTANALGLGALILLLWRPHDLFDVGAQLSFLAVAAMTWAGAMRRPPEREFPEIERSWLGEVAVRLGRAVKEAYHLMGAIWLFTLPLTMHRFHLISLVAVLINVALIPLIAVVMWLGYLTLLVGIAFPPLASVFAPGFDAGLGLFVGIIEKAALPRMGHLFAPGPPTWWVTGYYVILAAAVLGRFHDSAARCAWKGLALWTAAGLAIGLFPSRTDGLRCTFLSVGHGLSVLIETPNGGTLLYDAGSIQNSDRARWAVQRALWSRGLSRLDAVVVSHADIDHFNGVPGLVRSIPVGRLFVSRPFLDFSQPSVVECCEAAHSSGVPIRLIEAGDSLDLDGDVSLRILHPDDEHPSIDDNANSIVLLVEFRGRRILLTGDLEKTGTSRLLAQPPVDVDVLLSPHHGSVAANPKALAEWSQPEFVVASSGREINLEGLRRNYPPETALLATSETGCVTVRVSRDGAIAVEPFRGFPGQSAGR